VKRSLARSTLKMSRWIETDLGLVGLWDGQGLGKGLGEGLDR
jgi:hypothetical protein